MATDLKDDTAAEASLHRVTSYLLSWLVPAAAPTSAWDAPERSQLSQGDAPLQIQSLHTMVARFQRGL